MKLTFSFLLICFILWNVFTKKTLQRKISNAVKTIRNLGQEPETTQEPEEGEIIPTRRDEPESGDANAPGESVPDNKPVSSKGTQESRKTSQVQVLKFHDYRTSGRQIYFNVLLYYLRRAISSQVIVRLRITYFSRLRNLLEDSVPSYCNLKKSNSLTTGSQSSDNADYECEATALQTGRIANVSLNTDFDMQLKNEQGNLETLGFTGINFNGNSSEESQNLFQQGPLSDYGNLEGTIASTSGSTLKLVGTLKPESLLNGISSIPLTVLTQKNGQPTNVIYNCAVKQRTPTCELDCDTSSNLLDTSAGNLHLSTGTTSNNKVLTVYMANGAGDSTRLTTSINRYTYPKSSSGLSGGAIAGIVIACVAVLLAASIAVIMLRKPAPIPLENTTVVGLKTVDNA